MDRETLEIGARRYRAVRAAGEGSLEFKVAQDFWVIWLTEHGLELLNGARAARGLPLLEALPQNSLTTSAPTGGAMAA